MAAPPKPKPYAARKGNPPPPMPKKSWWNKPKFYEKYNFIVKKNIIISIMYQIPTLFSAYSVRSRTEFAIWLSKFCSSWIFACWIYKYSNYLFCAYASLANLSVKYLILLIIYLLSSSNEVLASSYNFLICKGSSFCYLLWLSRVLFIWLRCI